MLLVVLLGDLRFVEQEKINKKKKKKKKNT